MSRKSSVQRYREMESLISSYSEVERKYFSWDIKFMSAMMEKIYFKKALTKKMRSKIDELIELDKKPMPEKTPRISELENAMVNQGPQEKEVLQSFITKLLKGWSLTDGQSKFADSLVEQANRAPWTPSEEEVSDINIIVEVARTYDRLWFGNNPSASRVLQKLQSYISDDTRISESDFVFAKKKFAGGYKKIKHPRFKSGDRAYTSYTDSRTYPHLQGKKFCLIIEGPYVKGRSIVYDIMVDGTIAVLDHSSLYKRR